MTRDDYVLQNSYILCWEGNSSRAFIQSLIFFFLYLNDISSGSKVSRATTVTDKTIQHIAVSCRRYVLLEAGTGRHNGKDRLAFDLTRIDIAMSPLDSP